MEKIHKDALRKTRIRLVSDLHPDAELWDMLVVEGIFTPIMMEYIQAEKTRADKVRKLLDDLVRRGPKAYQKFMKCLRGSRHEDLANALEDNELTLRGLPVPFRAEGPPRQCEVVPPVQTSSPSQFSVNRGPTTAQLPEESSGTHQPSAEGQSGAASLAYSLVIPSGNGAVPMVNLLGNSSSQPGGHIATASQPGGHIAAASQSGGHIAMASQSGGHIAMASQPGGHIAMASQPGGHIATASQPGGHIAAASQSGGHIATASQSGGHIEMASQPGGHIAMAPQPGGHIGMTSQLENPIAMTSQPEDHIATTSQSGSPIASGNTAGLCGDDDVAMETADAQVPETAYQRAFAERPTYKMESNPRGYCLIINNKDYTLESLMDPRVGTDVNRDELWSLFNFLGFEVDAKNNLTGEAMKTTLKQFAAYGGLPAVDSVVVAFLCHGNSEKLYGVDGIPVYVQNDVFKVFSPRECPVMKGKPKLFLMNSCRGDQRDVGCPADSTNGGSTESDAVQVDTRPLTARSQDKSQLIPNFQDLYLAYSTFHGHVSYRNRNEGSWYIQKFVEVFREQAALCDINAMMTQVNRRVAGMYDPQSMEVQVPAPSNTLTKDWYFNPPTNI